MIKILPSLSVLLMFSTFASSMPKDGSLVMQRLKRNFEFGLGGGLENSSYEFRTPGASSVLSYDRMKNKQLHLDSKYKFFDKNSNGIDNFNIYFDASMGGTTSGEVRDDDVRNVSGDFAGMSYHNLKAKNRQFTIGFGRAFQISDNKILDFHIGYFNKLINARSHGNFSYLYNVFGSGVSGFEPGLNGDQISKGTFQGISIGSTLEKIIDNESSIKLTGNILITRFSSTNYWVQRNLPWSMNSSGGISPNGFELKAEYISAINKYASMSIFAYYQAIKAKDMKESQEGQTFRDYPGYARIESLGLGVAYRF